MKKHRSKLLLCLSMLVMLPLFVHAQKAGETKVSIDVNKPGHKISPTLFGLFFEDINLSTDGGIYPELVRDISFEDNDPLKYWKTSGDCTAKVDAGDVQRRQTNRLNPYNRKSLELTTSGKFKIENEGYFGMNIVSGDSYTFKISVKTANISSPLKVEVLSSNNTVLASGVVELPQLNATPQQGQRGGLGMGARSAWNNYTIKLKANGSDPKAKLNITGEGNGVISFDMISLMPDKTWKNHGLRTDLAEALDALSPTFLRFPGGCWVEGEDFDHMNHWKYTIGNLDSRTPLDNIWGYKATNAIGYHEYLVMAEDLGAEPLFCINAGVSHAEVVPMDRMGEWVQDALDAIEYANGPVTSFWGGLRAKNGHPAPFNMKYFEIGNENGGPQYHERYEMIANAVKAKYPDIILIANYWGNDYPKKPAPEIIDEHYYNPPEWFIKNANFYDKYDRKGPKIFVGEYAVTSQAGLGNLRGAIGEAAWMIGMERNSDIVAMGAYAPLLCNFNHKRWPINLINFDSYRWFGLPSYYVQEMFVNNQGTNWLPTTIENAPAMELPVSSGNFGLSVRGGVVEFKDLSVTSAKGKKLMSAGFSAIDASWAKNGEWIAESGILKPVIAAQPEQGQRPQGGFGGRGMGGNSIFMGDTLWTDYTISFKAKKESLQSNLSVLFRNKGNNGRGAASWNIAGERSSLRLGILDNTSDVTLEVGRWYDVKLEIKGSTVKGYIDGKLVQEVSPATLEAKALNVSAMKDDKSGDIIVKVVNSAYSPISTKIALNGATGLTGKGSATVLTSPSSLDENTLENPKKVSPKTEAVKFKGNVIARSFPANSLTVLRLPVR